MTTRPIAWTIAGTDPTAGAGIQADLKTFHGLGVHGCTVITAVIAQNTQGVQRIEHMPAEIVEAQLKSLADDTAPGAIKIGMLGRAETVSAVARALEGLNAKIVCDPVLASTSGTALLDPAALEAFRRDLLPRVNMLTPNLREAETLLGRSLGGANDLPGAAAELLDLGVRCVLLKGGHADGPLCADYWTNGKQTAWLTCPRIETPHTHGGGCTLSSAIAAAYALGFGGLDAIVIARAYVNQGLRHSGGVGRGRGPLAHLGWPSDPRDLPRLTDEPIRNWDIPAFPEPGSLGLYPIVDRAEWVERLAAHGVSMIQLRVKDVSGPDLEREIARAIAAGRARKSRVYINDHWPLAIRHRAFGVHIGQDDLPTTDLEALRTAGLRLGISTHGYAEIARATAVRPSYVAIGTIFPSPSKSFAHAPLGVDRFAQLRQSVNVPVVAIGGITAERAGAVRAAGADGFAVISDLLRAPDLAARLNDWRNAGVAV